MLVEFSLILLDYCDKNEQGLSMPSGYLLPVEGVYQQFFFRTGLQLQNQSFYIRQWHVHLIPAQIIQSLKYPDAFQLQNQEAPGKFFFPSPFPGTAVNSDGKFIQYLAENFCWGLDNEFQQLFRPADQDGL